MLGRPLGSRVSPLDSLTHSPLASFTHTPLASLTHSNQDTS